MTDRRRKRALSREEHALWRTVTQSVKPLRAQPLMPPEPDAAPHPEAPPKVVSTKALSIAAPKPKLPPPLTSLDRRTKQKVVRGSVAIDARIDLHGLTQERAHFALLRFVRAAHANDARLVLVITGKGAPDGERGVLRRVVPHWLSLPELRASVLGFETAHVAHGGEGALYVRIRRRRD
jgi:DNA-nicking Smr family endonuclease